RAAKIRVDGDGVEARQGGSAEEKNQAVTGTATVDFGDGKGCVGSLNPVAKTPPAHAVGTEAFLFQAHQVVEVAKGRLAQQGFVPHAATPARAWRSTWRPRNITASRHQGSCG